MEEPLLIYEKSKSGRTGCTLPEISKSESEILSYLPGKFLREEPVALPEITEGEVMRHYIGLSVKNHHIDKGFYPLGSCTMKYNPKLNDVAASYSAFTEKHPLTPCGSATGLLQLMWDLSSFL